MLKLGDPGRPDLVMALYESVGWTAYTAAPTRLGSAVAGSAFVATVWDGGQLVGLARAISDGHTIAYLQDVVVHPEHQRRGHGRQLVQAWLDHYADVRQLVLMTDDQPELQAFYRAMGLTELRELGLRAYTRP